MEEMNEREHRALVCRLVGEMKQVKSWAAETHIQKCVYFLQEMLSVPVGYSYILYKHAPYSFDLRRELAVMRARYQLDIESRYPYGPSFILGSRGKLNLGLVAKYDDAVKFVATELSARKVDVLERLSTALYVKRKNPELTDEKAARRINELKPHVKIPQAADALDELHRLEEAASEVLAAREGSA